MHPLHKFSGASVYVDFWALSCVIGAVGIWTVGGRLDLVRPPSWESSSHDFRRIFLILMPGARQAVGVLKDKKLLPQSNLGFRQEIVLFAYISFVPDAPYVGRYNGSVLWESNKSIPGGKYLD